MKRCPTCGSNCFDDMEVCYGCLHRFDQPQGGATPIELMTQELEQSSLAADDKVAASGVCLGDRGPEELKCAPVKVELQEDGVPAREPKHGKGRARQRKQEVVVPWDAVAKVPAENAACAPETSVTSQNGEWVLRIGLPEERNELVLRLGRAM